MEGESPTLKKYRFQESYNVKYFKEVKCLQTLQVKAETYLEPKGASTMKHICEYTYRIRKSSIVDN